VNTGKAFYFDDDDSDVHINKITTPLTTVIMFLLLLGLIIKFLYVNFGVVNSDNWLYTGFTLKTA